MKVAPTLRRYQVKHGIEELICNPELVKAGLDLLEFPTIVFIQSGYTVQQSASRSWQIGQKHEVRVLFLGYVGSSQMEFGLPLNC